jgi:hypothetical protein
LKIDVRKDKKRGIENLWPPVIVNFKPKVQKMVEFGIKMYENYNGTAKSF